MSWTSRLGNLGRFSPFSRPQQGPTKVSDSDFSYITADDLRRHQQESISGQEASESPVDYGPPRDTDCLVLRSKKKEYTVHFAAYSIAKNELTVGSVREAAGKKTGTSDKSRIKLFYKGKNLKDDTRTCKQEGLRDGAEILCSIADVSASGSESDDGEDGEDEGLEAQHGDGPPAGKSSKKRNRGKRTKKRNKREAITAAGAGSGTSTPDRQNTPNPNLAIPLANSQAPTRTASPKPPPTPATPLDKINALQQTLNGFQREVENFARNPPTEPGKKDYEHKRISETILTQVLLKTDAIETDGDEDARSRRKALVKEAQRVLTELDAANGKAA